MMAEKVEMKRTLLQNDLCRIQVFHMCGSKRLDNSRPDLDVQKNATQFTFVCKCSFPLRVRLLPLTPRSILLPRPIASRGRVSHELNFRLVSPKIRHLFNDILQEYSKYQ